VKQSINWVLSVFLVAGIGIMMTGCEGIGESRLKVNGFGEGSIMYDSKTGEAWVLEKRDVSFALGGDFISPDGNCYLWIPTSVMPCYKESIGAGRTPAEAKKLDDAGFEGFKRNFGKQG